MAKARSKMAAKGKDSVPAEGSEKYSLQDVHSALFPNGPPPKAKSTKQFKEGIRKHMRKRHAGR